MKARNERWLVPTDVTRSGSSGFAKRKNTCQRGAFLFPEDDFLICTERRRP